MSAPNDHSLLELINAAQRGGGVPILFSDEAVAAMHQGVFPQTGRGVWDIVDISGADPALTFTQAIVPRWVRVGPLVVFWGDLTYPATADTNPASIGEIPNFGGDGYFYTVGGVFSAISYTDLGQQIAMYWDGRQVFFFDMDGNALSNADMSGVTFSFAGIGTLNDYVRE